MPSRVRSWCVLLPTRFDFKNPRVTRDLYNVIDENARRMDVIWVHVTCGNKLVDFSHYDFGRRRHDHIKIPHRAPVAQIAEAVAAMCLKEGKISRERESRIILPSDP